jgi:hypothetical protein
MENERSIVRVSDVKLPKFVEQAYDSIEGMKQFANMLLESKLVPDSYYEKGVDNKPDYTKGKTSAVVIVLLQAQQLNVPPMTGLQHIVPVNGLLSIKGDLAKTMIFASGKLKKDSWQETVNGSIENEDMVVTITATREDNGITTSRSFSVDKAKRMGLWITSTQVNSTDGWKYKKSAWYKTPDRMIFYRCLGNLARDLFSDVLLNMYTTEEAVDIDRDVTEVIETESGAKITIPDKQHSQSRSTKITDRVAAKIPDNKFNPIGEETQFTEVVDEPAANVPDPVKEESPFIADKGSVEYMDGVEVSREGVPASIQGAMTDGKLTLEEMEKMETSVLLKIINDDMDMMEAMEMIEGKNTNKKLRMIIFASQNGTLAEHVAESLPKPEAKEETGSAQEEVKTDEIPVNKMFDQPKGQSPVDNFLEDAPEKTKDSANKYGIDVPEYDKGDSREFSTVKALFNKLMGVTPQITTPRYMEISQKIGLFTRYPDKEMFLKFATVAEINLLLNSN